MTTYTFTMQDTTDYDDHHPVCGSCGCGPCACPQPEPSYEPGVYEVTCAACGQWLPEDDDPQTWSVYDGNKPMHDACRRAQTAYDAAGMAIVADVVAMLNDQPF